MAYHTHIPPPFAEVTGTLASGQAPACGKNNPNQSGFTLVELSIVLVIIGLIIGGILAGQDLIRSAEIRAQVSQIDKYNSAVNAFKLKFNGLPADIFQSDAAAFGLTISGCAAGNNDGFINGSWPNTLEIDCFWRQLSDANLIDFSNSVLLAGSGGYVEANESPPAKLIGNRIVVYGGAVPGPTQWGSDAVVNYSFNYFEIHKTQYNGGDAIFPLNAFQIDTKIDDGLPLSGTVQAMHNGGYNYSYEYWFPRPPSAGAAGSANCVNSSTTPNIYNMTAVNGFCSLQIKAGF